MEGREIMSLTHNHVYSAPRKVPGTQKEFNNQSLRVKDNPYEEKRKVLFWHPF